jgi:hypothetical protein
MKLLFSTTTVKPFVGATNGMVLAFSLATPPTLQRGIDPRLSALEIAFL